MIVLYIRHAGSTDSDLNPNAALGQFFNQSCAPNGGGLPDADPRRTPFPLTERRSPDFALGLWTAAEFPVTGSRDLLRLSRIPVWAVITEPTDALWVDGCKTAPCPDSFRDGPQ